MFQDTVKSLFIMGFYAFVDFVVHLNQENENLTKLDFTQWVLPVVLENTNSRTRGWMHFVETTKIGSNE